MKHLVCALLSIPVEQVISLTIENPAYHNRYTDDFAIYVLNLRQINNENIIQKEKDTTIYQWAKLFKAESWEEIQMLAEKSEIFNECATELAQLTEDDKIRMQCEARNDYIARQKGLESRITKRVTERITEEVTEQVTQQVTEQVSHQVTIDPARKLIGVLDIPTIAEKTGLSVEQVEQLKDTPIPKTEQNLSSCY